MIICKLLEQLVEVIEVVVWLDGIEQVIMIMGIFNLGDCGVVYFIKCVVVIKVWVNIFIQAQCEFFDDFIWFECMKVVGVDSLGMYFEVVDLDVCVKIMFGKVEVLVFYYYEVYEVVVKVFGWGQVSIYFLVGLGDSFEILVEVLEKLVNMGVYFFVVFFVFIFEIFLVNYFVLDSDFMFVLYQRVGIIIK